MIRQRTGFTKQAAELAGALLLIGGAASSQTTQSIYEYSVPSAGYDAAGNVVSYADTITGSWTLGYDALSRLTNGTSSSGTYNGISFSETYDTFGNRTAQTVSTGNSSATGVPSSSFAQYNANNRISSSSFTQTEGTYDYSGNLTGNDAVDVRYDAEGRVCAVQSKIGGGITRYIYDAEGNRVAKATVSTLSCTGSGVAATVTNQYILGPSGEQVTELDGGNNFIHTNVFANGVLLATYDATALHFAQLDPLGTVRTRVKALNPQTSGYNGSIEEFCQNFPFGDGQYCSGPDSSEHHFTGKERDTESGLDYFGARYYGSSMGRFMSPDDDSGEHADQPQSWNLYSYVQNNPVTNTDPDGHDCIDTSNYSSDGTVTITRGDICASNLGPNGTYVNGTIDANSITATTNGSGTSFGYNFTSYDGQSGGAGVIAQAPPYGPLEGPANLAGANMIGNGGMAAINEFVKQSLIGAAFEGAGQAIGMGVDALRAARAAKAAEALAVAERVTQHAYLKHAGEFGNISRNEFQDLVQETMANPSEVRSLSNGRTAYWSDSQQMVVIENGTAPSQSTAFRPTSGRAYFDNMR